MESVATLEIDGDVAVLRIDNPPVNAISTDVVQGLAALLDAVDTVGVRAVVVACAGRTFVAGGDIAEFERPGFSAQPFNRVLARLEQSRYLVVAALHGTALGGGLELALACHYRVAVPGTRLGFPEVKLGLLPGSLGTQRLPRLAGAEVALDMILDGTPIAAERALACGIVDEIAAGDPESVGVAYARALLDRGATPRRASELRVAPVDPSLFAQKRQAISARAKRYPALEAIVRCVEAATTKPYAEGEVLEAELFEQCRASPQSKAMRHLFFAEREASRIPGMGSATRDVARVGVVGAGTMGSGIAIAFANAGIPVTLVDAAQAGLDRGLGIVRKSFESSAAKGRISADEAARREALVTGTVDIGSVRDCDLVIEAVFEDFALKRDVAATLGRIVRPGAVIATNTSTLDVDALAKASGRAGDFLGMHFFSPANVMRLVEVVRGAATAPDALATAIQVGKRIGKVPVVSGVCYGFIGNRMLEPYLREAERLLLEGASASAIDGALESLGMAMGPLRMLDLAGVDVAAKVVIERGKAGALPDDPAYRVVVRKLFDLERLGQKAGAGFYRYEGRNAIADPTLDALTSDLAMGLKIERRAVIGAEEIVERCLYPLINEGAKILEERIAERPGDVDVVWTSGYGFPDLLGGPMWMADDLGLRRVVERMDHYAAMTGNRCGYWSVSPLLRRCVEAGIRLSDWRAASGGRILL